MNKSEIFLNRFSSSHDLEQTCEELSIVPETVKQLINTDNNFRQQMFLIYFEILHGNMFEACKQVGISRSAIKNLAENNQDFSVRLWEITEGFIDLAESTLLNLGVLGGEDGTGDPKALKIYLEAKAKKRGYGVKELVDNDSDKEIYPGISEPKRVDEEDVFCQKVENWPTKDVEVSLKMLKRLSA